MHTKFAKSNRHNSCLFISHRCADWIVCVCLAGWLTSPVFIYLLCCFCGFVRARSGQKWTLNSPKSAAPQSKRTRLAVQFRMWAFLNHLLCFRSGKIEIENKSIELKIKKTTRTIFSNWIPLELDRKGIEEKKNPNTQTDTLNANNLEALLKNQNVNGAIDIFTLLLNIFKRFRLNFN